MKSFINLFISRPVFASMIILAMVVVGAAAYSGLGVDRYPSVEAATISVRTSLPGASPEDVENLITREVEDVVNTVDGIDELRSITGPGTSNVIATFKLDRDIDSAAQDVRDKVATVVGKLPEEADPPVISKFDNDSQPVMTFALSGELSVRELNELAENLVKVKLETAAGVGEVEVVGGSSRTINAFVDADRLASYGIPITTVRDAIASQNSEVPGGNLTGNQQEAALRTMGRLQNAQQFADMTVTRINGNPVRLKDIAQVEDGTAEQRSVSRLNGQAAVSLNVRRQSGANTVAVIDDVKAKAAELQSQLPPGVKLEVIRDQSNYIYAALHEINTHLILGSVFACLVVLAFTRSWRSTIIAGVAIPASVISTFAMMWLLDFTLNSVTMLALVLMVGIVIDDAIVVLENIFRFVEEKKMTPIEAARQGTAEIALAVLATTLSLAVIFVPVSFMSSISGRFLYQFGITAAVAVMVSLVVSFVLTPTLSARVLGKEATKAAERGKDNAGSRGGFYAYIDRAYTWMLHGVMRHRYATAAVALLVMLSGAGIFTQVQQGFLPQGQDEDEFQVSIEAPESISFTAMDEVTKAVEAELRKFPEVRTVLATAGGGFLGNVNNADIYVRIPPHDERYFSFGRLVSETFHGRPMAAFRGNYTQTDVMEKIRAATRRFQNVRVAVRNYAGFNIGGGNFDIDFSLTGPDLSTLAKVSQEIVARSEKMPGFSNMTSTLKLEKPEQRVTIDRERAADLNISPTDIGLALRLMVGGDQEVSRFLDPQTNENYDVRLRLAANDRSEAGQIPNLLLTSKAGAPVELRNIATVEQAISSQRIERTGRARNARIRGSIAPGFALADRTQALLAEINRMGLPRGYDVTVRGAGREFEQTGRQFLIAFGLSILFMYMILASQYENLIHPVTILLSLPLCLPFALVSLWLTGETLNLYSALGILVLFGVVKKNSILQIDHMNHLRQDGMARADAVIEGNRDRLRPILMTTLALVAGMLPLALGTGPGAEERRAVAIVVIGGQTLSLLLTLLVTPVAYALLDDLGAYLIRRRGSAANLPALAPTTTLAVRHAPDQP